MKKLSQEEINDVIELANEMRLKDIEMRSGQSFFNALHTLYPDVANEIRTTDNDPFYINERIGKCIDFIRK